MHRNVTYEQFDVSPNSVEVDYFKEQEALLKNMQSQLERWESSPSTATGAIHLSRAKQSFEKLYELYGDDNSPFTYRDMARLSNVVGPMNEYYSRLTGRASVEDVLSFKYGRRTERMMCGLRGLVEEAEECVAWAESENT